MAGTLVNGESFSWVKIQFGLLGNPVVAGISAINYKRKKTVTNNYMTGEEPVSQGEGKAEYDCGITLDMVEVRRILAAIPSLQQKLLSAIPAFTVTVSYLRGGRRYTDKIYNWRFLEDGVDAKEGDTNIQQQVACIFAGMDLDT